MASELYRLPVADALETIGELLDRGDVRSITVEDIDGEPIAEVPGTDSAEGAVRSVMDRFQEYEGGGTEVMLFVQTGLPADLPGHAADEPFEDPEMGEPDPHG